MGQYLWCFATTDAIDQIRGNGLEHLFLAPETTGCDKALLHLFESTSTCMEHVEYADIPSKNQVLLLCRVLCGSISEAKGLDVSAGVELLGSNDSIMCELPDGSHRFTIFSQ